MDTQKTPEQAATWTEIAQAKPLQYGAAVLTAVVFLGVLSKVANASRQYTQQTMRTAEALVQSALRAQVQAQQDQTAFLALQHAQQGVERADLARMLMDVRDINSVTGVDLQALIASLEGLRDAAARVIAAACPSIVPASYAPVPLG
jgi:hypothetical protein